MRFEKHIDLAPPVGKRYGGRNFRGGRIALHRRRIDDDSRGARTAAERRQHVRQRCRARRRHDADCARMIRRTPLARFAEPPRRFQPLLHLDESFIERAHSRESDRFDVELKFTACFVDRRRCTHLDGKTVLQLEGKALCLVAEEHALHLSRGVLELEVQMARRRALAIRDLARDPGEPELTLEQQPRRGHQQRNRQHRRRRIGSIARSGWHRRRRWKFIQHGISIQFCATATSTVQLPQDLCPGRNAVSRLSPVGNLLSDSPGKSASTCLGSHRQHIDTMPQTIDANLGIANFSMATALLSARIYKICTLPSTGNVDNVAAATRWHASKPLSGAVFQGLARSPS